MKLSDAILEVRRASHALARAEGHLEQLRSIRIGRVSLVLEGPKYLPPASLGIYDRSVIVHVEQRGQVGDSGVRFDQVVTINGAIQIVAETRFYSTDFDRSAIAKFEASHG